MFMNLDTSIRMAGNGRGTANIARTITTPGITAATATSLTVTALGAAVVAGDVLLIGTQGIWGICTAVSSNTVSVKSWSRIGGGENVVPSVANSLSAYPRGVLGSAKSSVIRSLVSDVETQSVTIRDAAGFTQVIATPFQGEYKVHGPWTAAMSGGVGTLEFEPMGDRDG